MTEINNEVLLQFSCQGLSINEGIAVDARLVQSASRPMGKEKIKDDYLWSSHKGYLSVAKKWKWLHKEFIFSMLTKNRKECVKQYRPA